MEVRQRLILSGCLRVVYTRLYQAIENLKPAREAIATGDLSIPNNDQDIRGQTFHEAKP